MGVGEGVATITKALVHVSAPQAYPLQWPAGKPRTAYRVNAAFGRVETQWISTGDSGYRRSDKKRLNVLDAYRRLQVELDRLGASFAVCSTNMELRVDGIPRSDRREPDDPGVAVYFQLDGDPVVLACDRYDRVADNVAAIAAHLRASRAIERYGVGSLREIFRGFAALPPAMSVDDWRARLGNPKSLEDAESVYRERMKKAHPDVGGDAKEAAALNAAIERAREVLA